MATAAEIALLLTMKDRASPVAQRLTGNLRGIAQTAAGVTLGLAGAFGLTIGLRAAADTMIGFNARLEQSQMAFTRLLGSGERANVFLRDLERFAAKTPFEFPELIDASRRMLAFGFSAERVMPLLTAVGDAVAAFGGNSAQIDRVTLALGQMQAKGRVSAEEMLQLVEAGIPAWRILSETLGVTTGQAQKLAEQGKIASAVFIDAFETFARQNYGGMMEMQAKTFQGAMSTIKDSVVGAIATAFKPLFTEVSGIAQAIAGFVQSPAFARWADETSKKVQFVIDTIKTFVGALAGDWGGTADQSIAPVHRAFGNLGLLIRDTVLSAFQWLGYWWYRDGERMFAALADMVQNRVLVAFQWLSYWWYRDGERTMKALQARFQDQMPLALADFSLAWDELVMGNLNDFVMLWRRDVAPTFAALGKAMGEETPMSTEQFYNAFTLNFINPLSAWVRWWKFEGGKETSDAMNKWLNEDFVNAVDAAGGALSIWISGALTNVVNYLNNDVVNAIKVLQSWLGSGGQLEKAIDDINRAMQKWIADALKPIVEWIDRIREALNRLRNAWENRPSMPTGGGSGFGGGLGGGNGVGGGGGGQAYAVNAVVNIDARGGNLSAIRQATGDGIADLARTRIVSGVP